MRWWLNGGKYKKGQAAKGSLEDDVQRMLEEQLEQL